MKNLVAVIVYDRFDNMKRWIECWKQCDTTDSKLVIIHNDTESNRPRFGEYCRLNKIDYILRENIGMDIGALQDLARQRLKPFDYNYENLIWCTDDCLPMSKTFIQQYTSKMTLPGIGVVAMHISDEHKKHIRTTGICLKKDTLGKLVFPADPILTKEHCYQFEHRGANSILEQIHAMGLTAMQVAPIESGPFWDSGRPPYALGYVDRRIEHYTIFPKYNESKVLIFSPAYNRYPQIIPSLLCQTHQNWELHLRHDGPNETGVRVAVEKYADSRIFYSETVERRGKYGHPIRQDLFAELKAETIGADSKYLLVTNEDNYHMPVFLEKLVNKMDASPNSVAAYCSDMVHNYTQYSIIHAQLCRGRIDCGSALVRLDVAKHFGWRDDSHSSDWIYFEDILKVHQQDKWIKVPFVGLVHN